MYLKTNQTSQSLITQLRKRLDAKKVSVHVVKLLSEEWDKNKVNNMLVDATNLFEVERESMSNGRVLYSEIIPFQSCSDKIASKVFSFCNLYDISIDYNEKRQVAILIDELRQVLALQTHNVGINPQLPGPVILEFSPRYSEDTKYLVCLRVLR